MSAQNSWTRRGFLVRSAALGCSAAASPLLAPVAFASAPWDNRLVVILLRGAMDGMDVVQPYGDPNLASLRKTLKFGETGNGIDLDGYFSLHPALSRLSDMWGAGELGFAHAVSTPYRDKRSHFDGQDLLEAGTGQDVNRSAARDGWLNRLLQIKPEVRAETGFAIGRDDLLVLKGAAPVANWSPGTRLDISGQSRRLLEMIYHDDPLFQSSIAEAMDLAESLNIGLQSLDYDAAMDQMRETMFRASRGKGYEKTAKFAAERLRGDTRIAAFSINGWDTHSGQARGLTRALEDLQTVLLTLQSGLGPVWEKTAVLAMTEFGRTARENGSKGTDHGTGGAMFMAGGAIRGGKIYSDWPGLETAALYKGRDLMPTADVRAYAAAAMQGLFGLDRQQLENAIFPGLDMTGVPNIIR